jgi:predicted site-specific integrase-resolvase
MLHYTNPLPPQSRRPLDLLLSRTDVLETLSISPSTLTRYVRHRLIWPAACLNNVQFFEPADVEKLVGVKGRKLTNKKKLLDTRNKSDILRVQ